MVERPVPESAPKKAGSSEADVAKALKRALPDGQAGTLELDAMRAALSAELRADAGPVGRLRSLPTGVRVSLALVGLVLIPVGVSVLLARPAVGADPVTFLLLGLSALVLMAGIAPMALRGYQKSETSASLAWGWAGLALLWPVAVAFLPQFSSWVELENTPSHAVRCLFSGIGFAVLPLILFRLLDRGAHGGGRRLVLAAVSSGLSGVLTLELMCPIVAREHVLFAHAIVPGVVLAVYWVLKRRISVKAASE